MFGLFLIIYHQTILLQRMKLHCTWVVVISVSLATFWGYQRGIVTKKLIKCTSKNLNGSASIFPGSITGTLPMYELHPFNEIISKLRPYDF